uniref:Protein C5 component of RNase P (Modular protein) n=1 Tax=mine drainage metagenome TaxID=410659 RepID=E6QUR1_9ZZZZ
MFECFISENTPTTGNWMGFSLQLMLVTAKFLRTQRLLNAKQFAYVLNLHCCARGTYLQVCARPCSYNHARLGVVAGKKQLRTAVSRNFAKRQIREFFRLNQHLIPVMDYVVRINRVIFPADVVPLHGELLHLFKRAARCREDGLSRQKP